MGPEALASVRGMARHFLSVPRYIPTKYRTIHIATIIYDAFAYQSTPPLAFQRVAGCPCAVAFQRVTECSVALA